MMQDVEIIVGGSLEDGAAFVAAWTASECCEDVTPSRVLAFESWEGLSAVLTGERYRLLRHLHRHPEPSVSALARSLGASSGGCMAVWSPWRSPGLVDRSGDGVRATADRIRAEIVF